ncbi:MAG: hypothetical protein DKT66_22935 [Candidatus Melainabacteria bacterium]|nr:MAG: hypothetical protein DKT66_22935 [Candidatus Melainabacteria bacterium]
MKRASKALLRWIATPFAALAGYGLGYIVSAALQGAIAFFTFVPFVTNILWISGAVTTYLSATWATGFAVRCAPALHQKIRWLVLIPILVIQLLRLCAIPAVQGARQNMFMASAIEGFVVICWLMLKAKKRPL